MNRKWLYAMPFILISSVEFLYAMRYFADDDKHGWNGLIGLGIVVELFLPTIIANLIIAASTRGKLKARVVMQILISTAIFIYYWNDSLH